MNHLRCASVTLAPKTILFKQKRIIFHHIRTAWPRLFAAGLPLQVQLLPLLLGLLVLLVLLALLVLLVAEGFQNHYPSRLDNGNPKTKDLENKNIGKIKTSWF